MHDALMSTNFFFPNQKNFIRGKVRDVYEIGTEHLVVITSDRISAFDHVLPRAIPYKGQVLNQIASKFLQDVTHIVPTWLTHTPDPNVSVGVRCTPFKVEMVIRGYLSGHAWREYKSGKRIICGATMPEGMKESDKFPEPIITPSSKAETGHDIDMSPAEIVAQGLMTETQLEEAMGITRKLFDYGSREANARGLILVDTKYEFGVKNDTIYLLDEIHTPDSSRYFYLDGYEERQEKNESQKQLSKEFVRQWLIEHGFQGLEGQKIPEMTDTIVDSITDRYVELYEKITGKSFIKTDYTDVLQRIENNVIQCLGAIGQTT
jgi:phosphoribosylaminoimidazole-succinocarboxamide synthase